MKFRMNDSVFPGDTMVFGGTVDKVGVDDDGCGWVDVTVSLSVEGKTVTTCATRIALPTNADDNPWGRRGNQWNP